MKSLTLVSLIMAFNSAPVWSDTFDCTALKIKEEKMACLEDLRLLENKYTKKDACEAMNKPKTQIEYKMCVAVEVKKDPCYIYRKYGIQEGSDYEKCFIGKEESISNSKREAKPVEGYAPMGHAPASTSSK